MTEKPDPKKVLNAILAKFKKDGTVQVGTEVKLIDVYPTGFPNLDYALRPICGLPKGKIIEIYGNEGVGKSSLVYGIMKHVNAAGGTVALIDMEHSAPVDYLMKTLTNGDKYLLSQPGDGEEAMDIACILAESGSVDLIVVDSVAALVGRKELENPMDKETMGLLPRLVSKACRKLVHSCYETGTTIIFVNQTRANISGYGEKDIAPGGKSLRYYSHIRMKVFLGKSIIVHKGDKKKERRIGQHVKINIVKFKHNYTKPQLEETIIYGDAISESMSYLEAAVAMGILSSDYVDESGSKVAKNASDGHLLSGHPVFKLVDEQLKKARIVKTEKKTKKVKK